MSVQWRRRCCCCYTEFFVVSLLSGSPLLFFHSRLGIRILYVLQQSRRVSKILFLPRTAAQGVLELGSEWHIISQMTRCQSGRIEMHFPRGKRGPHAFVLDRLVSYLASVGSQALRAPQALIFAINNGLISQTGQYHAWLIRCMYSASLPPCSCTDGEITFYYCKLHLLVSAGLLAQFPSRVSGRTAASGHHEPSQVRRLRDGITKRKQGQRHIASPHNRRATGTQDSNARASWPVIRSFSRSACSCIHS